MVLWRTTRPYRTTTTSPPQKKKKKVLFIIGDWNAKVGSQKLPGVTGKFGLGVQNEAGQRPTEFYQENTLVIANTLFQQEKTLYMDITKRSTSKSDWLYSLQPRMYILYSQRWRSSIQSTKTRPGADCGSAHELLMPNSDLNWRKWGKPFRYDINQIPYDYTVEVTNRFKELDLIECVKNYGGGSWHCIGGSVQNHLQEK